MLSGCSSAAISRTSAQNRASVSPGSEAEGVDDDGDGVDTLRMHRGQIEAAVDEAAVGGHSSYNRGARHRPCSGAIAAASRGCSGVLAGSSPRPRLARCLAPGRGSRPGAWPRPTPAPRRACPEAIRRTGPVASSPALVRVHDLAGAARVVAGGRLPGWFRARAIAARSRLVLLLRTVVAGGI